MVKKTALGSLSFGGMGRVGSGLSGVDGGLHSPRPFAMSFPSCAPPRIHRHLIGCLVAALLLVLSPRAFATTLVPMCGERAQTVVAPPPMQAARDASLSIPCSPPSEFAADPTAPSRAPEIATQLDAPPRMPAVYYRLPRAAGDAHRLSQTELGRPRPGFSRGLERPPR